MKGKLQRYIIKANNTIIGHAETKRKAWRIANIFADECANQDEPFYPTIRIEKQILEGEQK